MQAMDVVGVLDSRPARRVSAGSTPSVVCIPPWMRSLPDPLRSVSKRNGNRRQLVPGYGGNQSTGLVIV